MKEIIVFVALMALNIILNTYGYLSIDIALFFAFILIVALLMYRDKKNVKLESIVFIRRTKKGRDFIDKTANSHKKFWKTLGTLGVVIMIPTLVLGSFFLISQSVKVIEGQKEGGVRLLLPGPVSTPTNLPGAFVVPWWIWVIGIAFVIIPHEFMHGIMCRLDKVRIKSVGWILLIIIPGAFVEPDEAQLKKARRATKMRVYAAGSFANILVALIVISLLTVNYGANFQDNGIFVRTINDTPGADLGETATIVAIDNHMIKNHDALRETLLSYNAGDKVEVKMLDADITAPSFRPGIDFLFPKAVAVINTSEVKTQTVTLAENNQTGKGYLGVGVMMTAVTYTGGDFPAYQMVTTLLMWIYIFSLGIGIVNILPIKPLDGGLLLEEIVKGKNQKTIVKVISTAMLLILLFNLLGPIFL